MDFKEHIVASWKLTLNHIVPLILLTLVFLGVSAVSLGVLAPAVAAGYIQSILMLVREGREPKMQDLFSHMKLFLPLLAFGLACMIVAGIGFMLLFLPGMIISFAMTFLFIFVIPLMTDRKMGLVEAVKQSCRMATSGDTVEHLIVVILFLGITMIGGSVFIGTLFTQPLATVFLMSVFEERSNFPVDSKEI